MRGRKDPGVGHPPRNRVKIDWENKAVKSMYEGAGYSTKRGSFMLSPTEKPSHPA